MKLAEEIFVRKLLRKACGGSPVAKEAASEPGKLLQAPCGARWQQRLDPEVGTTKTAVASRGRKRIRAEVGRERRGGETLGGGQKLAKDAGERKLAKDAGTLAGGSFPARERRREREMGLAGRDLREREMEGRRDAAERERGRQRAARAREDGSGRKLSGEGEAEGEGDGSAGRDLREREMEGCRDVAERESRAEGGESDGGRGSGRKLSGEGEAEGEGDGDGYGTGERSERERECGRWPPPERESAFPFPGLHHAAGLMTAGLRPDTGQAEVKLLGCPL